MSFVDPRKAYFAWRHYNPSSADDPRAAWDAGVRHGMRQGIDLTTEFRPLLPLLNRLIELLEERRVMREAVAVVAEEETERADRLASDPGDDVPAVRPGRRAAGP